MIYIVLFLLLAVTLALLLWPLRQHKTLVLSVSASFFVVAFLLYGLIGSPQIIPLIAERSQKMSVLKGAILEYSERIKTHPNDLEAWVGLGQSFIESGQWEAATNAFKQSVLLSKGDPRLIMAYAKSMILSENGAVSDQTKKSLEMVLLQQPRHEEARYWLIVRKLQDGKTEAAMKSMKELYGSLPTDSPVRAMIDRQIGRSF